MATRKAEIDLERTQLLGGSAAVAARGAQSAEPTTRPRASVAPAAPRPASIAPFSVPGPGRMPSEFPGAGVPDASGGIEVMVIRHAAAPQANVRWRAFELWTKHRVYGMDSTLECRQVLDRRNGALESTNPVIGLRLGGGKLRVGNESRYTYPFPAVGMDGIFSNGKRSIRTSRVERFLIRIRDLSTQFEDDSQLTWEGIANGE